MMKLIVTTLLALTTASPALADLRKRCQELYASTVIPFQELGAKLDGNVILGKPNPATMLLELTPDGCGSDPTKILELIDRATSFHSGKIGLILNLTGDGSSRDQGILKGMQGNFPARGAKFEDRIIVRDSKGHPHAYLTTLAELVFKEQVGIIISGSSRLSAQAIGPWAQKLKMPMVMLSHHLRQAEFYNPYLFSVYPSQEVMANLLVHYAVRRGFKKIAILQPNLKTGAAINQYFINGVQRAGIKIAANYAYTSFDYSSMEDVAKQVFKINIKERENEYKTLYDKAKEEALAAKVPFNPNLVSLPPKVEVDAIYIPDNFRMVRHFVKIFKYLGVREIPLFGTQEWRAPELVDPAEPFLNGAAFADYIGSYSELPARLAVLPAKSPYFVSPETIATIDFEIIGFQAGHLSDRALQRPPIRRRALAKKLAGLTNIDTVYFPPGFAFDDNNNARWPAFLFQVQEGAIVPLKL